MNALDTSFGTAAADDVWTSLHPAGTETGGSAGKGVALRAADWLCLAAAPTFAIMAVVAGFSGGGSPDWLCAATRDASPLSGMVPMYVLMSAFHSAPWLKLIFLTTKRRLPVLTG
jgi:hypothetical protein